MGLAAALTGTGLLRSLDATGPVIPTAAACAGGKSGAATGRLTAAPDPEGDRLVGTRVRNDIADLVFGSTLARMASAAQVDDGPVWVKDTNLDKKAVAYRFTSAGTIKEYWAIADGVTLSPASASDPALAWTFGVPNNQPASTMWSAFVTWADLQFSGTKDWFEHVITVR